MQRAFRKSTRVFWSRGSFVGSRFSSLFCFSDVRRHRRSPSLRSSGMSWRRPRATKRRRGLFWRSDRGTAWGRGSPCRRCLSCSALASSSRSTASGRLPAPSLAAPTPHPLQYPICW